MENERNEMCRIPKSKILSIAKKYPQCKVGLSEICPEAFGIRHYKCGTIFIRTPYPSTYTSFPHILDYCYILVHLKQDRTYGLINMRTGYSPDKSIHYFRRDNNSYIEIPDEDLEKLELVVYLLP